ncbi:MAG: hypothetical protein IJQ73_06440, partial [Kiritimatiellae bacterium]|nr:hypothetical protein [Kiritimatiellia bacterium]
RNPFQDFLSYPLSHKGGFPAVISPHFQASAAKIGGQSSLSKLPAPVTAAAPKERRFMTIWP